MAGLALIALLLFNRVCEVADQVLGVLLRFGQDRPKCVGSSGPMTEYTSFYGSCSAFWCCTWSINDWKICWFWTSMPARGFMASMFSRGGGGAVRQGSANLTNLLGAKSSLRTLQVELGRGFGYRSRYSHRGPGHQITRGFEQRSQAISGWRSVQGEAETIDAGYGVDLADHRADLVIPPLSLGPPEVVPLLEEVAHLGGIKNPLAMGG